MLYLKCQLEDVCKSTAKGENDRDMKKERINLHFKLSEKKEVKKKSAVVSTLNFMYIHKISMRRGDGYIHEIVTSNKTHDGF